MAHSEFTLGEQPVRDGRIGIIDIGSNSIRLVIYDQQKRSPVPIFNEKAMCELGKGLANTGMLNPAGVEMAKEALRRFLTLGRNMEIVLLHVMATAAVRDARDGAAFVQYLEETYDIHVDVVTGQKEARLGALGVCSSMYRPHGMTGDLGGGSLELVHVEGGKTQGHHSLLLGSLRMIDESKGDRGRLRKLVEKRFADYRWTPGPITNFYAIGGSFRALAKMHMAASGYPLRILHEYGVPAPEMLRFVQEIAIMPLEKLEKFPGAAPRRAAALPGAAMVFEHIIEAAGPEHIVFSASGIREGYLYEKLSPYIRSQDGLLASCTEFAVKGGRSTTYASELYHWMQPLLEEENARERRLRLAFCLLVDVALHIHPEYRAEWAYYRILQSALTGLSHRERVMLSLALYHRYHFKLREDALTQSLLTAKDRDWARLAGIAAHLAYHLCGSIAGNLQQTELLEANGVAVLDLSGSMKDVAGDAVKRRMDNLREAYAQYKDNGAR